MHQDVLRIKHIVSQSTGVSIMHMEGPRRSHKESRARHLAMYMIRTLTRKSFPQISAAFNKKDHTTSMHAFNKIADLRKTDINLQGLLQDMTNRFWANP